MVAVKSAVSSAEPAAAPARTDAVEPAGPTTSPLADSGKGSADRNEAVPFQQKSADDRSATSLVQAGTVLAHPAPDSSQTFDAMPPSPMVAATSSLPGSSPGFIKSGRSSSQQRPDFLPPSEQQGSTLPAIKIVRRAAQPQTDPLLTAAYAAYQQGDFKQSRSQYQMVLQADPEHRGAMLGRAALALRSGETDLARSLYLRLLERDPSDPYAKIGLMTVMPKNDPAHLESELKLLLDAHPNVAQLSFLLGNLYAAGQRWNEAQQAYFNALQAADKSASRQEAVSPDYPFNLAVSLEHLNKPDLAARYYREALKLATSHPAGFDKEALRRKLENFQGKETP
jgi:tetratricopeptide (TPR) repeat protein